MISVIIPSYNGKHLLEKFLATNKALFVSLGITDIIIADDASQDDSVAWLNTNHPDVTVVVNDRNKGFGETANLGASAAKTNYLFFLNNDMLIKNFDLDTLLSYFQRDEVWAVVPKIVRPQKNKQNESITWGCCRRGWFKAECSLPKGATPTEGDPIFWGCGGALLCRKDRFEFLGAFDGMYSPFYFEDMSLSWQAWRHGWEVLYHDASEIHHDHMATIGSLFSKAEVTKIHHRNKYLIAWTFLETKDWPWHALHILRKLLLLQFVDMTAMIMAFGRLDRVKLKRRWLKEHGKLSNEDLFKRLERAHGTN